MTNKLILTLMALLLASCGMMSAPSVEQPTPIPTFASADSTTQDPAANQVPALGGKQSGGGARHVLRFGSEHRGLRICFQSC